MKTIKMISVLIIVLSVGAYIIIKATLTHIPIGIVGVRTQEYAIIGKNPKNESPSMAGGSNLR